MVTNALRQPLTTKLLLQTLWSLVCIFFFLTGFGLLFANTYLTGLILMLFGVLAFPLVSKHIKIHPAAKVIVYAALFILAGAFIPPPTPEEQAVMDAEREKNEVREQNLQKSKAVLERQKKEFEKIDDHHWQAYSCTKQYLPQLLKNPRDAKFASKAETRYKEQDGIATISGWVDATNSFGATLRTQWRCRIVLTDTTCKVEGCDLN